MLKIEWSIEDTDFVSDKDGGKNKFGDALTVTDVSMDFNSKQLLWKQAMRLLAIAMGETLDYRVMLMKRGTAFEDLPDENKIFEMKNEEMIKLQEQRAESTRRNEHGL